MKNQKTRTEIQKLPIQRRSQIFISTIRTIFSIGCVEWYVCARMYTICVRNESLMPFKWDNFFTREVSN